MILPWVYYIAVLCYRRMSVRYCLTTQRFVHERGILRRVNDRIEVLDMDDITFEQGLLERLSGVGTIRIAVPRSDRSRAGVAGHRERASRWRRFSTTPGWPNAGGGDCTWNRFEQGFFHYETGLLQIGPLALWERGMG